MKLTQDFRGVIHAEEVRDPILFTEGDRVLFGEVADHRGGKLFLRVWLFDLTEGVWVRRNDRNFLYGGENGRGHIFHLAPPQVCKLLLGGRPFPSSPEAVSLVSLQSRPSGWDTALTVVDDREYE